MNIIAGNFYFLDDKYYEDFSDPNLMKNRETSNGIPHDRPCFISFQDSKTGLYWLIPISSQVPKYRNIYNSKMKKTGRCDTIVFGDVLGYEKAFLIQNMCPVTEEYIKNQYTDNSNYPVKINAILEKDIISKAKKVLNIQRNITKSRLILPDVLEIEKQLISQ